MRIEENSLLVGRVLLGLYFILPGLIKIFDFSGTAEYMREHGMVLVPLFLTLAIIAELGGGIALVLNYQTRIVALLLAGLVIIINVTLHDFWSMEEGIQRAHELQNFVKNTAIMAGLLVLAGSAGNSTLGS